MIVLYDFDLSGNSHKVRLMLSMLGLTYVRRHVNLFAHEQDQAPFVALNPKREVPVLVDGDLTLYDSQGILLYLAASYGPRWMGERPAEWAGIGLWLSTACNEISRSLQMARLFYRKAKEAEGVDIVAVHDQCHRTLRFMDDALVDRNWLAAERPTVADIACFPYVALAHEGRVALDAYPNILRWVDRVGSIPGFVGMEGIRGPSL